MKKADRIEAIRSINSATREPAVKWLKKIQQELAPKELYAFAKEWGGSQTPIEDPIAWTDDYFNRIYVQPLLEALRSSDLLVVAHIPVGILYTHDSDPNAYAIKPIDIDCCPVIAIDWTLFLLIQSVVPIALHYLVTPKGNREPIRQRIRDCILDVTSSGRLGRIPRIEHDDSVMIVSHAITSGIFAFLIAHEYGHIVLGDFDPKDVTVKKEGFAKYNRNRENEYEADLLALEFASYLFDALEAELRVLKLDRLLDTCPLITMTLIGCLERHFGILPDSSTHPPSVLRRVRLQLAIDSYYSSLSKLSRECVELFDWVFEYNFEEDLIKYAHLIK